MLHGFPKSHIYGLQSVAAQMFCLLQQSPMLIVLFKGLHIYTRAMRGIAGSEGCLGCEGVWLERSRCMWKIV